MPNPHPSVLERAARALAKAQSGVDDFDALDEGYQETLKENVRAVLRAVREPSEGMIGNGALTYSNTSGVVAQTTYVWQAMIDTALEEG